MPDPVRGDHHHVRGLARAQAAAGQAHGEELPVLEVGKDELAAGIAAYELMCRAGLTASNGEARRLIKGGGGRLNNERIADDTTLVGLADGNAEGLIKLSAGKKRHALVRIVERS